MKILIIEDNYNKAGDIKRICNNECSEDDEIYTVTDIKGAFSMMHQHKFNLVIMDMCLPDSFGDTPKRNGGITILSSFRIDHQIKIPGEMIVLTGYEDVKKELSKEVEKYSFECILYDDSSCEWENKLSTKIKYLQMSEESPQEKRTYKYDIAIVTAVEREDKAVEMLDNSWKKISIKDDSTYYLEAEWKTNSEKKLRVIRTMLPQMGMVAAATITTKLIMNFSPRYVIMPGIAAGAKNEYNYGDIIIPGEVKDYCSGKYATPKELKEKDLKNPLDYFEPSSFSINTDFDIINMAKEGYRSVLEKIHDDYPIKNRYSIPQIRTGNMACGDSVIQNKWIVKTLIKKHLRQADGIDMETYGVYYAAMQAISPKPIPICMKAISDFANKAKNDKHQEYAAYVSAQFMKYFIENVLTYGEDNKD